QFYLTPVDLTPINKHQEFEREGTQTVDRNPLVEMSIPVTYPNQAQAERMQKKKRERRISVISDG
uniref:Uncharacterized protein n=1 Tax=Oryza brachyantha TaxID=4533 RepID=J3N1J7_ORYBR